MDIIAASLASPSRRLTMPPFWAELASKYDMNSPSVPAGIFSFFWEGGSLRHRSTTAPVCLVSLCRALVLIVLPTPVYHHPPPLPCPHAPPCTPAFAVRNCGSGMIPRWCGSAWLCPCGSVAATSTAASKVAMAAAGGGVRTGTRCVPAVPPPQMCVPQTVGTPGRGPCSLRQGPPPWLLSAGFCTP